MSESAPLTDDAWPRFEARLRAYVGRRVEPQSVNDVIGDIMLKLVRNQAGLSAASNPTAWMIRVAAHAVSDHHRRKSAERRKLEQFAADGAAGAASPETEIPEASREIARCMVPMIRQLPEAYEKALMLTEIQGLSQAEAAKRLGLSYSGLKSRVQRGRAKLKSTLLRCCRVEVDGRGCVVGYARRRGGCSG